MKIEIKLAKNVGVEYQSGTEIISDVDYAELLQNRLEIEYPEAEVSVESTYDLVERMYIEGVDYSERHLIENTIQTISHELWQECLDAM